MFTCVLHKNISETDVVWYRSMKSTNSTEIVGKDSKENFSFSIKNSTVNSTLLIYNATKPSNGFYWIKISFLNVCNASLTVLTSM